jgi:serine/threonine protein kinase
MSPCPGPEQLRQLLADGLSGSEAEAVEAHVEACAACQQRLEELTGNAAAPTVLEPACRDDSGGDFLRRLEQAPPLIARVAPESDGEAALLPPTLEAAAERGLSAVAGYEVLGELGRGGMGVVYKACHLRLHRVVALKMVLAGVHAGKQHLARFRHEAETVAQLQHPHVVQIYEVGEHDGRPFLALEYVPGGSLGQRLDGTPQPPRAAAELIQTLARAVQAAHDKGVIHRDLKPANVLLTADGTPKLKSVRITSTWTGRPTTCLRSRRTSTAILRSARHRRGRTWGGRRGSARTRRINWACATCTATCGNGAPISSKARAGWSGAAAGTSAAPTARRRSATGARRRTGTTSSASDLPEFPSGRRKERGQEPLLHHLLESTPEYRDTPESRDALEVLKTTEQKVIPKIKDPEDRLEMEGLCRQIRLALATGNKQDLVQATDTLNDRLLNYAYLL